jgi:hypothetical protein
MAGHAAGLERLEITMQPPQHGHGWVGLRYAGSASSIPDTMANDGDPAAERCRPWASYKSR